MTVLKLYYFMLRTVIPPPSLKLHCSKMNIIYANHSGIASFDFALAYLPHQQCVL